MQVFEQDHDRLSRGQPADQPGHALEQPDHVPARRREPGHADFGQQRRELASPGLGQRAERLLVRRHLPAAKRIDPRRQGQHLLVLVAASEEHPGPALERLGDQRRHEAALADAGLTDDRDEVAAPSRRLLERPAQMPELHLAAEERRLVSGRLWDGHARRGRQPVARRRAAGSLAEQFLVELLRLRLRLDAHLALEHPDALLVLPERRASSPGLGVQPHQRPVRRLLQRVQPQQRQPCLNGGVGLAGLPVLRQELRQRLQRQLAEPLPLPQQPLLEPARPLHAQPRQQVPPVERRRRRQRRRRPLGDPALERRHVDLHRRRVQRDRVALHAHPAGGQRPPQREQRLAEAVPGLALRAVSPEQRRELVARMRPPGGQSQVGQQRLGLPRRQGEGRARAEPGLEAAQEGELEGRHFHADQEHADHSTCAGGGPSPRRPGRLTVTWTGA